jgi:hypothetical protein
VAGRFGYVMLQGLGSWDEHHILSSMYGVEPAPATLQARVSSSGSRVPCSSSCCFSLSSLSLFSFLSAAPSSSVWRPVEPDTWKGETCWWLWQGPGWNRLVNAARPLWHL